MRRNGLLLFILLVAMIFRLTGIFWGLPLVKYMGFYHPDESKIIDGAYEFPMHILTNLDLRYPTAFHYSLGILSLPLRFLPYPDDYYAIYTLGRVLSVLFGTATVLVVFLLAKLIYDRRHALLAAFLIAFSMLHVANSAWATTDVLSSLLLTLFLLLLLRTLEATSYRGESNRLAIFTGLSLGLLIGAKYTGTIALIPLLILFFAHERRENQARSIWYALASLLRNRLLWIIVLVALGTFLLSTPGLLRHPFAFMASLKYEVGRLSKSYVPLYDPRTYGFLFQNLSSAMGLPLAIASLLGMILALFRRKDVLIALIVMLLVFTLYFGSAILERYYLLVMPILAMFASSFLFFIIDALGFILSKAFPAHSTERSQHKEARIALPRIVGYILTSLVCLYAFLYSLAGIVSRYPDTRTQAARYISENIPPGSSIGLGHASKDYEHSWHYPRIDSKVYDKWNFIKHPDYIVLSSYDYEPIRETLQRGILNQNYTLPRAYWKEWYQSSPPTSKIFMLNEELWLGTTREYCLIKKFLPRRLYAPIEFPAPTLEIYARQKQGEKPSAECQGK